MEHGFGAKPFKKDDRDWLLRDVDPKKLAGMTLGAVEEETATRKLWRMHDSTFRIDQLREGTCTGHGTTNLMAGAPMLHSKFPSFADVDVAHDFARALYFDITGDTTYQKGAIVRDAMQWCVAHGYAAAYYRLLDTNEVIDYLLNHGMVGFASPWYNSMWNVASNWGYKRIPYLKVDPYTGYSARHFYVLSGVDLEPDDGRPPRVRKWGSWGPDWGLNGTAAIAVDDLPLLYQGDAWALTETKF